MAQKLLAGTVQEKDFATFIKAYKILPNTPTLMLLEMQPRNIIEPTERQGLLRFELFDPNFDFTLYTSGRIFHIQSELRWEKQLNSVQVIYTGDEQYKPELTIKEALSLDSCTPVERRYFLFGKRLDKTQLERIGSSAQSGDFAEVRIPRLLRYPSLPSLADAERVQLVVCEYVDSITGTNVAYRFQDLVRFQKPVGAK